jgi:putative FmdB family regulatory protein
MPLRDFLCLNCGHEFETLIRADEAQQCPHCESAKLDQLPALPGGYQMSSGPSSVRPKRAGSFKGKKVLR